MLPPETDSQNTIEQPSDTVDDAAVLADLQEAAVADGFAPPAGVLPPLNDSDSLVDMLIVLPSRRTLGMSPPASTVVD